MFTLAFGTVMGLIVIVLLNAGALAAARASQRMRELSLRRALGARTRDLMRHALAEQVVLTVPGAVIGVALAPWLLDAAGSLLPLGLTLIKDAQIDWRVAAFAGLVTGATAFLVALFPVHAALRRRHVFHALAEAPGGPSRRTIAGRALVAGQVAVAFVLILGGAFFTTSLLRAGEQEPGLRTHDVAMATVLADEFTPYGRGVDLASSLRSVPGVAEAAVFSGGILSFASYSSFRLPGPGTVPGPSFRAFDVGSGFFEATGIRLLHGRFPSGTELDAGAAVLVVSDAVARQYWPDRSAIDQTLAGPGRGDHRVIGVVEDVRWEAPDLEPTGAIYAPWVRSRGGTLGLQVLLTFDGDPDTALTSAVAHVTRTNPDFSVRSVEMLAHALDGTLRGRRFSAVMASVFGVVALTFIAIGLLGLVAMTASRRTREVGIRMALGARPAGVVRQLIGEQLGAVVAGILIGGVIAAWAVRFVQAHLYETGADDPAVWTTTVAVMLATATLGAFIPAHRASRVDPVQALREN
jgi:predicted permease